MARLLALLASGVWSLAGPPLLAQQAPPTSYSGVVRDAQSDDPILGVLVSGGGQVVRTDAAGRFAMALPADTVTLTFRRIGYRSRSFPAASLGGGVPLTPEPVTLDELVASATRPAELAVGTALFVASVPREDLAIRGVTSVAEGLAGVEGLSVQRQGSWGAKPILRGLGGERIAVMVNGLRVNRACTFGMDQGLATVDPATIERVEVLAGPGSTLYGSGNVGGVINVITRRAAAQGAGGELRLAASSGVPGATVGASYGAAGDRLDLALSGGGSWYGDYHSPAGAVPLSAYKSGGGDLLLGYRPRADHRVALHGETYEGWDIGYPATRGATIPRESRRSLSLDYGWQASRRVVDAVTAHVYVQRLDHHMVMTMTMSPTASSVTDATSKSTTSGGRAQLRLIPLPGSHIDVGGEAINWNGEATRWTETMRGDTMLPPITFRTWPGVNILDLGVFAQGQVPLMGALTASAGARYDGMLRRAQDQASVDEGVATGNLGLALRLGAGLALRSSIGWGYRVPDPTELYGLALRPDGFAYRGNAALVTETSRNLEGGVGFDRGGVSATATLFTNHLANLISPRLSPGDTVAGRPVRVYDNVATATLAGGSMSFLVRAIERVQISGSATYTWGQNDVSGGPLAQIPPLEGGLAVRFAWRDPDPWIEIEARAATRQERVAAGAGEQVTPAYQVLNLRAGLTLAQTELVLGVANLLDETYRTHVDPAGLMRPGRNGYLSVRRGF